VLFWALASAPVVALGQGSEGEEIGDQGAAKAPARPERRSPGTVLSDTWITAKTKIALFADDRVSGWDVHVDTRNGVVDLQGEVGSDAARSAAEQIARSIDGVQEVRNNLQVAAQPEGRDDKREDRAQSELEVTRDDRRGSTDQRGGAAPEADGPAGQTGVMTPEIQGGDQVGAVVVLTPDQIRLAQQRLKERGFDPGQLSGVVDEQTQTAIRDFQKAEGLRNTGRLDIATSSQLGLDESAGSQPAR
jgi:hyperosmotically inducible protein